MKIKACRFLLALAFFSLEVKAAQIVSLFPTGPVKSVQQVSVRFSAEMVSMGDPRSKNDPLKMTCLESSKKRTDLKHTTRWADTRNWILEFDKPLPSGVKCTLFINPQVKDLAGEKVEGAEEYSFSTSGPNLKEIAPQYGQIEPDQYFVLEADGEMDEKSMAKIAYFEVEGMPDKVGVSVIKGKDRDEVLAASFEHNWKWKSYREQLRQGGTISQLKNLEKFVVIAATRRFPESAKVVFHWPQGILSKSGLPVEEAQNYNFEVIAPFTATFSCERSIADRPCNPILNMSVGFSKPVSAKLLQGTKLISEDGKTVWTPEELKKKKSELEDDTQVTITFNGPFPASSKFKIILPDTIRDMLGRKLVNQDKYPLEVSTDEALALIKFSGSFGILELKADPILPVSVRNVEKQLSTKQLSYEGKSINFGPGSSLADIIKWYRDVTQKEYSYQSRNSPLLSNETKKFSLPRPKGEKDFELIGIPLKRPGFYVVELESPKLGLALTGNGPMYVATSVLVTDLAVHFKQGRESSLVWVTRLSDASPVKEAEVTIVDDQGVEIFSGKTNSEGILKIGKVDYPCGVIEDESPSAPHRSCEVFAFAKKDDDVSFVSSSWTKGIESYRFNVSTEYLSREWGPVIMHTILDRMAAQPGETINMNHVLREHKENGFSFMNEKRLPKRVLIVHQGSLKTYTLPFEYNKNNGMAVGKFSIPKDATLGRYNIYLSNKTDMHQQEGEDSFDWSAIPTGHFIVSEYRLPLMKASVKVQGEPLIRPKDVKVDLSAGYLSGGAATGLKVKLRASLTQGHFTPDVPGGSDYNFFSTPVKVGVESNRYSNYPEENFLKVQELTLNQDGGLLANIPSIPQVNRVQNLSVEMEYTDPNGEVKTAGTQVPLFPSESVVGLRTDSWYAAAGKTKVSGVITTNRGRPLAGNTYTVHAFKTNYFTHRKRLIGGFYSYDSKSVVEAIGKVCEGKSDENGRFSCTPNNLPAGSITLEAKVVDTHNHATYSSVNVSIYEKDADMWYTPSDSDRIDILPEKNRYGPTEKAKFIVMTPFETSTVLLTVEREGVIDSFVKEIHRDDPSIEIPLKGNYAPNVFVSALVVRGRIGGPAPTALLDLARPAMKMGITEIKVGWKAHELTVDLKADKDKYKAREKVIVTINVKSAADLKLKGNTEVTVVAVDEALLRLKENTSWKLLQEMMGQRPLAVSTSSGQNQVIGRRHFGSKAKPAGGGGGSMAADARQLFDPILFWKANLKLDKNGEAKVTIPLNDSMTSFRIVAVATNGKNFYGDGQISIESTKDLIIYSGFAPLAREGDSIQNAFTIRNTTTEKMQVELSLTSQSIKSIPKLSAVELKPSEAKTITLPLVIPQGTGDIQLELKVKDKISGSEDILISKMKIVPAIPAKVLQATLFQLEKRFEIPVKQPTDAITGKGGLNVSAQSTLVTGLAGVKNYMDQYPYSCLEQKVSKAVVLEDEKDMEKIIEGLPSYFDSYGLLKFFPVSMCGSPQLTRYVMNILSENGYNFPQETQNKMINGIITYLQGNYSCYNWWDNVVQNHYKDQGKILLLETLSRFKAFNPAFLTTVKITPNLWNTETIVAWYQLLKHQNKIADRDNLLKAAENILKSRVNFQGSLMNLQNKPDWEAQWRLFTSGDQEAMGVFGLAIEEESWGEDVGRLARGIVARLNKGVWETTLANAWGVTKLRNFSKKFEKDKVAGETKIIAQEIKGRINWSKNPAGETILLNWPANSIKENVPVQFNHDGSGKPWIHLQTLSAIPLKAPLNLGYEVTRKIAPVVQETPGQWKVGDVVNVELTITAKADQPWVVVRDPIPAGASHLGTGLDGSSQMLNRDPKANKDHVRPWPAEYDEKSHQDFISYAAYLSQGTYRLNYRIRLNSAGDFHLPPTRVEAMYSPETFGETPNANWKISQ